MKQFFFEIKQNLYFILSQKRDLLLLPLLGGATFFLQEIMNVSFYIDWASSFNVWGTAFITSMFLFMLFDLTLDNLKFFKKYNKVKISISFFVSTFVGETISYSLKDSFVWWHWIVYAVSATIFTIALLFFITIGISFGKEKAKKHYEEETASYFSKIESMSKQERSVFIKMCNKALELDDSLLSFIMMFHSKDEMLTILDDFKTIEKKS